MKPELHDELLERELRRRSAGEWQPDRVLPAVRQGMGPRPERVSAAPRWIALAGLVGVLVLLAVLAVALPRPSSGPSAPSPTFEGQLEVLSTEEFAARLESGELNGATVLVEGRIEELVVDHEVERLPPPCSPDDAECRDPMGVLSGFEEIRIGKRWIAVPQPEATMHGGSRDGWQWWDSPVAPVEGTLVFSVGDDRRPAFLGRSIGRAQPHSAAHLRDRNAAALPVTDVLLVDAWLGGRAEIVTCRRAQDGEELPGLPSRRCIGGESWLMASSEYPGRDVVRVQNGAYRMFSRGPGDGDDDHGPRRAVYAVAKRLQGGGCPAGDPPCWDWEIVARFEAPPDPAPTPTPTQEATSSPTPHSPADWLTCRPYVMGGAEPSPGPATYPLLDVQLHDLTQTVVDCAYFSEFATLPQGQSIQSRWHERDELGITWNVAHVCPSSARVELIRDDERYVVTVGQAETEDCGNAPGRQAVVIWFDGAAERTVDASMVDDAPVPPSQPTSAPAATRIECVEIFAPPSSSDRPFGVFIADHTGVLGSFCQGGRDTQSDSLRAINPDGNQLVLEIWWPVPEVCDYMPAELEVWLRDGNLLVHIDRRSAGDEPQACRAVVGAQGVLLNLNEPVLASTVEMVLTTEGAAMSAVYMPAAGMTWTLSLVPGKAEYAVDEPIEVEATLAYDGDTPTVTLVGSGSGLVTFSVQQLDGDLSMGGPRTGDCSRYEMTAGEPQLYPYQKGAGWSADDPNAEFYRSWVGEPDFTLPPGTWRIDAYSEFYVGDCGGRLYEMEASIVITVR